MIGSDFENYKNSQFKVSSESQNSLQLKFSHLQKISNSDIAVLPATKGKFKTVVYKVTDRDLFRFLQKKLQVGGTIKEVSRDSSEKVMIFQGKKMKEIKTILLSLNLFKQ